MYLISVYFDDKSNKIIFNYINKIAQKTGNTFMTDNHVPPHLTIMSVEAREEKKLTEVMEQLERSLTKGRSSWSRSECYCRMYCMRHRF